jgi:hypothetical protein
VRDPVIGSPGADGEVGPPSGPSWNSQRAARIGTWQEGRRWIGGRPAGYVRSTLREGPQAADTASALSGAACAEGCLESRKPVTAHVSLAVDDLCEGSSPDQLGMTVGEDRGQ